MFSGIILVLLIFVVWGALALGLPAYIRALREENSKIAPRLWSVVLSAAILYAVGYLHHRTSSEVIARQTLDKIVDLWESGRSADAMERVKLAARDTPWRQHDRVPFWQE